MGCFDDAVAHANEEQKAVNKQKRYLIIVWFIGLCLVKKNSLATWS
jgi:hypothetical protein